VARAYQRCRDAVYETPKGVELGLTSVLVTVTSAATAFRSSSYYGLVRGHVAPRWKRLRPPPT